MKIECPRRKKPTRFDWHWRFAWLPVRVSATRLVWWEFYYCRLHQVAEGCWAGGEQYQWECIENGKSKPWIGPLICN